MSTNQRALSTKEYYDTKTGEFMSLHPHYYEMPEFTRFIQEKRDQYQDELYVNENRMKKKNKTKTNGNNIDQYFDASHHHHHHHHQVNDINFTMVFTDICILVYINGLQASVKSYFSLFGEMIDGYENISKDEYYRRIYERFNLTSDYGFIEFSRKQKIIESLAIASAFERHLGNYKWMRENYTAFFFVR